LGAGVQIGSIEDEAQTFRLHAHRRSFPHSTTVTWFNCSVEVTDQVTNEPSHQVTALLVSPNDLHFRAPVPRVADVNQPGAAADLAVFGVLLIGAAPGVEGDLVGLAALGAFDERLRIGVDFVEREVGVALVLRPLLLVGVVDHARKVVGGVRGGRLSKPLP
jgi:hypothetical protein